MNLHYSTITQRSPTLQTVDADGTFGPAWPSSEIDAAAAWQPDVCYLQGMNRAETEVLLVDRFRTVMFGHNYHGTCASGMKYHARPTIHPCTRAFGLACLPLNYISGCGVKSPLRLINFYREGHCLQHVLQKCDKILTASRHMMGEFIRQGVSSERVHLAPLWPSGISPQPEPPEPRSLTGRVLFCGRCTRLKGGQVLLAALPEASARLGRPLRAVFAGDGPARAKWEMLAVKKRASSEFVGWCDAAKLNEIRRNVDVQVIPGIWPEPFGLVGIEAGCVGLPSVGFAMGGIPDWLIPGESGESVPPPVTPTGLAETIVRALSNPEHLHRLRQGAWEVAKRFTLQKHLEILEPCLAETVEARS